MRGRKPKPLPEDYIMRLHDRGYSPSMISYILQRDFGISVSRWTIWRRIRNSATTSKAIQNEKAEVNCKKNSLEGKMKGWYHISISKKNLVELERIGEKLKEMGIEKEPRRKKDMSYDRIIQELIQLWKRVNREFNQPG